MLRSILSCAAGVAVGMGLLLGGLTLCGASAGTSPRFQFLPARQNLWVVDHQKGAIIFFTFPDNEERPIQRSRTFRVDRTFFPPGATRYILSQRNLTSLLWIVNQETGDVQVLRYRRDGTFSAAFRLQAAREFE